MIFSFIGVKLIAFFNYRIVNMMCSILLSETKGNVVNKKRFYEEFKGSELIMPKKNPKPEDYEHLFQGNIDDNFRIGLSFTKKSVKVGVMV